MAIIICSSCGGTGCRKCRDGFVDIPSPYERNIVTPKPTTEQAKLSMSSSVAITTKISS